MKKAAGSWERGWDDDKGRTQKNEIMKAEAMKNDIIGGYFRLK